MQITKAKDKILEPIVLKIPNSISANHISLARLILAFPLIYLVLNGYFISSFILFLFAMALDLLDGPLARHRNTITEWGKIIDPIADKALIGVVFIIMGFFLLPVNLYLTILIIEIATLLGSFVLVSLQYLKKLPEADIASRDFGKYKILLYALGAGSLLLGLYVSIFLQLGITLFWLGAILSIINGIQFLVSPKLLTSLKPQK